MKKKFLAMTLASVMTLGMVSGVTCSAAEAEDLSGTITAAGSSALKPLADDAANAFSEKYPDVAITIDAGGSGEGLKQVAEGTVILETQMWKPLKSLTLTRQESW